MDQTCKFCHRELLPFSNDNVSIIFTVGGLAMETRTYYAHFMCLKTVNQKLLDAVAEAEDICLSQLKEEQGEN